MGQKVHPYSFRLGYIKDWTSRWFAKDNKYAKSLQEDIKIRKFIKDNLNYASISKVEIEKASQGIRIIIYTARPGVIIGRRGAEIDRLKEDLENMTSKVIFIDIKEVKNPTAEAQLIAGNIAFQLERRISFRRAIKRAIQLALENSKLEGIKVAVAGRLGGIEMSRRETYKEGKIPLQTIRADVDFGFTEAQTTYGTIGVKVWTYKGDVLLHKMTAKVAGTAEAAKKGPPPSASPRGERQRSEASESRHGRGELSQKLGELPLASRGFAPSRLKRTSPQAGRALRGERQRQGERQKREDRKKLSKSPKTSRSKVKKKGKA